MLKLTAVYELKESGWWIASVPEIPGCFTQGATLEEAKFLLQDAMELLFEVRREDAEKEIAANARTRRVVREEFLITLVPVPILTA